LGLYEKIQDKVIKFYDSRGKKFEPIDAMLLWITCKFLPKIFLILIFYWIMQKVFIGFMLPKYGFEKTILYLAIVLMLRPMLQDIIKISLERD
jgi:hypothetical protein